MTGIAEITVNGAKVRLKFGMPAIQMIYEKIDTSAFLSAKVYNLVTLVQIIYGGYVNSCIVRQEVPQMTFEDVFEWMEENQNSDELGAAIEAFNNSKYIKMAAQAAREKEEEKKRLNGKKLKRPASENSH